MRRNLKELFNPVVFLLLPIAILISGALASIENPWFYILSITWFCLGLIILMLVEDL